MVGAWAKSMTEKHFGGTPFEIGDRIMHKKHGLVEITSGQYWGTHGISNFWYWREVLDDGTLSKKEHCGYALSSEGFDFTTKTHPIKIDMKRFAKKLNADDIKNINMELNSPIIHLVVDGKKYRLKIEELTEEM